VRDALYVAWRYLTFHRWRSVTLLACITLMLYLPLALNLLLAEAERNLLARANTTPLLLGAKGSSLDLVMNSLYFGAEQVSPLPYGEYRRVLGSGLALGIPIYSRFSARGLPLIGTGIEYFEFRNTELQSGRMLALLGETVLGSEAAASLGLQVGDELVSSSENAFDLAGVYPLKMRVVGVLKPTHTPDDLGVFVDLKTAWVIQGLGHGHQDLKTVGSDVLLDRGTNNITANAKLEHYASITADNIGSFHFHGDLDSYPVTAVIVVPNSEKAGILLRGRYLGADAEAEVIQPNVVIDSLLNEIFRIKHVIDGVLGLVSAATLALIGLVFALSLRLRQRELSTLFRLGASRATTARLIGSEVGIIVIGSGIVAVALLAVTRLYAGDLIRALLIV